MRLDSELSESMARDGTLERICRDPTDAPKVLAVLREGSSLKASNQVQAHERTIDTASLIFAHAALDAGVSELCWIAALARPEDWADCIAKKKVPISDLEALSPAQIRNRELAEHLRNLERESLPKRVQRLFALCKPNPSAEYVIGFKFDGDRLASLDTLRHRLVHHEEKESDFTSVESDLEFLFQVGIHLWAMLNKERGVTLVRDVPFGSKREIAKS
jgi:hypothetical protein